MKLTLTFETNDVREMLEQHFERNRFRVRNLEELVMQFVNAYPDGIRVDVDVIADATHVGPAEAVQAPAPVQATPPVQTPAADVVTEEPVPRVAPVKRAAARLSASDLFDPEFQGIKEHQDTSDKEIQHILRTSQEIEKTRS
jgi:hypothetical protein